MSLQISKNELSVLTDFQNEIHLITQETEEIGSIFFKPLVRSTWYSTMLMKLPATQSGADTVYTVNNTFHFLLYTYLRFVLPTIKVKKGYENKIRIAWCHNIGNNIVSSATFKVDDAPYHTWDNYWADIDSQFNQRGGAGHRENHQLGIGNTKLLENWTTILPSMPINVSQPWFYSLDRASAFPIFYKGALTRAEHIYTFKKQVTDLLRIQVNTNGNWTSIPGTKNKTLMKYLSVEPNSQIETPELWGRYGYITENELTWYKSCLSSQKRISYIKDVAKCDAPNSNRYGSTSEIRLVTNNPCLALYWMAENMDAHSTNNFSNYTTDADNLYNGWDPIKNVSLKYGNVARLDKMPADHLSIAEPRNHCKSSPCEVGYHCLSFCDDSTGYNPDVGIIPENLNVVLNCAISNNNPELYPTNHMSKNEDIESHTDIDIDYFSESMADTNDFEDKKYTQSSNSQQPEFITRARLLIIRKLTITSSVDQNGGEKYEFSIQ